MDTVDQLGVFEWRAEQLVDTRLLRKGFNAGMTINYHRMQGLRFESRDPNEDDLRSFLLTFRQFVSKREPVYLNRIYNLCRVCLTSDQLRRSLVESREAWKTALKGEGFKIVFDERHLTPEYVTDLWINGFYFHSDEEKLKELRSLLPFQITLHKFVFLDFLVQATRQVLYVASIVRVALREGLINETSA